MTSVKEYFNRCDKQAFVDEKDIDLIHIYLNNKINFKQNTKIMSLGSGLCDLEKKLARDNPNSKFMCVDFIDRNLNLDEFNNIAVKELDLRKFNSIDFKESYDLIYSFSVLQYLSDDEIIKLNKELLKLINDDGIIYHFDIPDRRKKYISRFNKKINLDGNIFNITNKKMDFKDKYSRWISMGLFKDIRNADATIIYPSFRFDRFEVKINKAKL